VKTKKMGPTQSDRVDAAVSKELKKAKADTIEARRDRRLARLKERIAKAEAKIKVWRERMGKVLALYARRKAKAAAKAKRAIERAAEKKAEQKAA
jgi:hypothetical protein